jgi:hypothetical protein
MLDKHRLPLDFAFKHLSTASELVIISFSARSFMRSHEKRTKNEREKSGKTIKIASFIRNEMEAMNNSESLNIASAAFYSHLIIIIRSPLYDHTTARNIRAACYTIY